MQSQKEDIYFKKWQTEDFITNINLIKQMRKLYSSYPYLYHYNEDDENNYLESYIKNHKLVEVYSAYNNNVLIGVSIGCPLKPNIDITSDLFKLSIETDNTYYFGDILVDPKYSRKNIAKHLYALHITDVKSLNFKKIYALLVVRANNDPRQPHNFNKSNLWNFHNFRKTKIYTTYSWKTIQYDGTAKNEENKLSLYEKIL